MLISPFRLKINKNHISWSDFLHRHLTLSSHKGFFIQMNYGHLIPNTISLLNLPSNGIVFRNSLYSGVSGESSDLNNFYRFHSLNPLYIYTYQILVSSRNEIDRVLNIYCFIYTINYKI